MNMPVRKLLLFIISVFLFQDFYGKDFFFRRIDTSDGLPHNTVFCMAQDSSGFIWIGTRFGLCRYDGHGFITYNASNSPLHNHTVRDILPANDTVLYLATEYGAYAMDILSGDIRLLPAESQGDQPRSVSLCISPLGNLLVASEDMGLFTCDGSTLRHAGGIPSCTAVATLGQDSFVCSPDYGLFRYDETTGLSDSILDKSYRPVSLYPDGGGVLWVGTLGRGLLKVSVTGSEYEILQISTGNEKNENIIKDIIRKDGSLYLATEGGLIIYDSDKAEIREVKYNPADMNSLGDNALYSLLSDSEGGIWIGTYFRGISYIPPLPQRFQSWTEKESGGVSGQAISSFLECDDGEIIITSEDNGFCYFDQDSGTFRQFEYSRELSYNNIHDVCLDAENDLWIGTYLHGIDRYDTGTGEFEESVNTRTAGLHSNSILRIFKDSGNNVHIGTSLGSSVYDPREKVFRRNEITRSAVIRDIFQDSRGNIWYASMNKGLFRYNPETGKWDVFCEKGGDIPTDKTVCIRDDRYGNIWIGTEGFGILKYDYREDSFDIIDIRDNLQDNFIFSLETSDSLLWIGTTKGLCRYNPYSKESHLFTEEDGLPSHYFNYNASRKMEDGTMYFGTVDGFFRFKPECLPYNGYVPESYITSLVVRNRDHEVVFESGDFRYLSDDECVLSLPYNQNNIRISFAGLSYSQPRKNRFQVWLQGYDNGYGDIISTNYVQYNNLLPGTYRLHLRSSNDDNVWGGEESSLTVRINKPFWSTAGAKAFYLLLFLVILYVIADSVRKMEKRKSLKQLEEKEKEDNASKIAFFTNITHEIKTPLALLHSPLDMLKKENGLTQSMRRNIAIMDRNLDWLDKLVEELLTFRQLQAKEYLLKIRRVDINDFIKTLSSYFEQYAAHNGIELKFLSNISPGFLMETDPEVLSKILSNLITNAFKFTKDRVIITLRKGQDAGHIRIDVLDNGKGVDKKDIKLIMMPFSQLDTSKRFRGVGLGLPFAKSLAESLEGTLTIKSRKGSFFIARVILPVHNNDSNAGSQDDSYVLCNDKPEISIVPGLHLKQYGVDFMSNGHILIVEDNIELVEVLVNWFKDAYCVGYSNNGRDALKYIGLYHPDIVISDVMMPEMDGIELCRRIKGDQRISHTSVVMLTAKTGDADRQTGLGVGADAYISKPFSLDEISLIIKNLLKARQRIMDWALKGDIDIKALNIADKNLTPMDREFVVKVSEILTENISNAEFSAEDLARELGMSKTLVYIKLKKLMNMSSTECIQSVRFNRAKDFLLQTEKNISEIAYDLGFSDPNYFTRAFKRHFGMTPTQYRAANAAKDL